MAAVEPSLSQLRLLILSPAFNLKKSLSPFPPVLTQLTSISPAEGISSFAGYTSHEPLALRTKYYSKNVSIWCDELPSETNLSASVITDPPTETSRDVNEPTEDGTIEEWKYQMLSAAAREVRTVIGGITLILPTDDTQKSTSNAISYIKAVHALREAIEDDSPGRDIASIVILQPQTALSSSHSSASKTSKALARLADELSNQCIESDLFGWDVVSWLGCPELGEAGQASAGTRNEFGEKLGMARVIEVLEGVDWNVAPDPSDARGEDAESDDGVNVLGGRNFSGLDSELQQEMLDLKFSILDNSGDVDAEVSGEDISTEQMDSLKSRVLAIRETVTGLPEAQREAFAKREIDRIMKEM